MLILAMDAALARCSAAVVVDERLAAARQEDARQGHAALLPAMLDAVLQEARVRVADLDLVAVTVGPGSFTGIRAGLALAHGLALAAGIPVVGVTVGEALADSLPHIGARKLWSVIDNRRGRVFLERDGVVTVAELDALPLPERGVAVAGDAASRVAARLAARDADVMLTDARLPMARHISAVAGRRFRGELPAREALPLYVDPPEAKLPARGLRPPPAG